MFNGVINMAEERYKIEPIGIRYKCDKCGKGYMELKPGGMTYLSNPPKYEHICNHCGHIEKFTTQYPYVKYE